MQKWIANSSNFIKMYNISSSNILQYIEIIIDIHSEGYVFNNLQKLNILF